jgi:molybdenum-dependent DNA-binding transcriptional regulator ModE
MAKNGDVSAAKSDRLALGVAGGMSLKQAAATAKIPYRTAWRLAQAATFKGRVNELRNEFVTQSLGRLTISMSRATITLVNLLHSADERVQLSAASRIIDHALAVRQAAEIEQRLAEIEQQLADGAVSSNTPTAIPNKSGRR